MAANENGTVTPDSVINQDGNPVQMIPVRPLAEEGEYFDPREEQLVVVRKNLHPAELSAVIECESQTAFLPGIGKEKQAEIGRAVDWTLMGIHDLSEKFTFAKQNGVIGESQLMPLLRDVRNTLKKGAYFSKDYYSEINTRLETILNQILIATLNLDEDGKNNTGNTTGNEQTPSPAHSGQTEGAEAQKGTEKIVKAIQKDGVLGSIMVLGTVNTQYERRCKEIEAHSDTYGKPDQDSELWGVLDQHKYAMTLLSTSIIRYSIRPTIQTGNGEGDYESHIAQGINTIAETIDIATHHDPSLALDLVKVITDEVMKDDRVGDARELYRNYYLTIATTVLERLAVSDFPDESEQQYAQFKAAFEDCLDFLTRSDITKDRDLSIIDEAVSSLKTVVTERFTRNPIHGLELTQLWSAKTMPEHSDGNAKTDASKKFHRAYADTVISLMPYTQTEAFAGNAIGKQINTAFVSDLLHLAYHDKSQDSAYVQMRGLIAHAIDANIKSVREFDLAYAAEIVDMYHNKVAEELNTDSPKTTLTEFYAQTACEFIEYVTGKVEWTPETWEILGKEITESQVEDLLYLAYQEKVSGSKYASMHKRIGTALDTSIKSVLTIDPVFAAKLTGIYETKIQEEIESNTALTETYAGTAAYVLEFITGGMEWSTDAWEKDGKDAAKKLVTDLLNWAYHKETTSSFYDQTRQRIEQALDKSIKAVNVFDPAFGTELTDLYKSVVKQNLEPEYPNTALTAAYIRTAADLIEGIAGQEAWSSEDWAKFGKTALEKRIGDLLGLAYHINTRSGEFDTLRERIDTALDTGIKAALVHEPLFALELLNRYKLKVKQELNQEIPSNLLSTAYADTATDVIQSLTERTGWTSEHEDNATKYSAAVYGLCDIYTDLYHPGNKDTAVNSKVADTLYFAVHTHLTPEIFSRGAELLQMLSEGAQTEIPADKTIQTQELKDRVHVVTNLFALTMAEALDRVYGDKNGAYPGDTAKARLIDIIDGTDEVEGIKGLVTEPPVIASIYGYLKKIKTNEPSAELRDVLIDRALEECDTFLGKLDEMESPLDVPRAELLKKIADASNEVVHKFSKDEPVRDAERIKEIKAGSSLMSLLERDNSSDPRQENYRRNLKRIDDWEIEIDAAKTPEGISAAAEAEAQAQEVPGFTDRLAGKVLGRLRTPRN